MRTNHAVFAAGSLAAVAAIGLWLFGIRSPSYQARPEHVSTMSSSMDTSVGEVADTAAPRDPGVVEDDTASDEETHVNWLLEYTESGDLFDFAQNALRSALAGDHRAQYLLGQVLAECRTTVIFINLPQQGSQAANIEEATRPFDEAGRRRLTEQIQKCERFFVADPVATLPNGQREIRYWLDLALEGGDAFALMDRALRMAIAEPAADSGGRVARRVAILDDVRRSIATKDPAVLYRVGGLYSNPMVANNAELQGPAWIMAACAAGYDCSSDNPNIGFGCGQAGTQD